MVERIPARIRGAGRAVCGHRRRSDVDRLYADGRWLEGPAYHRAGRFVLFSDIPNDRVLRYDEISGRVDVFLAPAGFTNGRTVDRQGRFVTCEHGNRRVTRIEHDGSTKILADAFQGQPLNSPNDVVEHADGSIWFTDPTYGIKTDYEGHQATSAIGSTNVYRWAPSTGELTAVSPTSPSPTVWPSPPTSSGSSSWTANCATSGSSMLIKARSPGIGVRRR